MGFIQNLFSGESIIVVVVGFIIGFVAKKNTGTVEAVKNMTDDLSAWMGVLHDGIADGSLNRKELVDVGSPVVDTFEGLYELVKKKKDEKKK